ARVGRLDGEYVLNPTMDELLDSDLDLIVAGTQSSVLMVESEAKQLTEEKMLEAVKFGHEACAPIIKMIEELKDERERFDSLMENPAEIERLLLVGAEKAKPVADAVLNRFKTAIGF
ncbi:MAG: hypothetical protein ACPGD8_03470, partial [Flavobacteriales bacterium]